MKILIVGGAGTIGKAVVDQIQSRHETIVASRSGDLAVDLKDPSSIDALFDRTGDVDAVVSAAGGAPFVSITEASPEDFLAGFTDKLAGQINLVLRGLRHVRDGGSFTLTTGILAREPIATGAISSTVNGGLEAFVTAAATELPRELRINAVSPSVLTESLPKYGDFFPGFTPVPAHDVARAFVKSIEGVHTGRVYNVG